MPVRSSNLNPQAGSSHIVSAEQLSRAEPVLRRFIAILLWIFSYAGNVLAFGGGWEALGWNKALLVALATSLVYQVICTVVQFISCRYWWNPLYIIALGASGIASVVGYQPLIAVPLTEWVSAFTPISGLAGTEPPVIMGVHLLMCVGLVAVDIIPERVFVKH